ncbi:lymphokine-activated killer T-cell-originated protein kinase homolog isoform X2 [Anoplopoma fimbria]|uniref:lymphokine-activated killer T-cell-originated protein kinase homolog isoform X2 n=1 Tax=Anoplopoma fimbria TaxID=229290 RepID=UPI0023EB441A|nr:lymphokine-activated killer T-cell-originated protein kinase homolog isoform X2 [Anoplopoma fimbria]
MFGAVSFQNQQFCIDSERKRRMASSATCIDEGAFKTPKNNRVKSFGSNGSTPVTIPASPFMKKLGCGTGVNVYLMNRMGKLNASPWAVKKINTKCATKQVAVYQKRLNEEAEVLKGINHPNIVGFRAFTTAKDGSKCLAMEYGGEQSLNDLIEKRKEDGLKAFPAANIDKVALHVARGLQYLHNEKKLLHGDMKSCNVVIKGDFETVKICDVGVSLQLDENMRVSDPKAEYIGTEPWKPKEALDEGGEITDKADIYAYGLTLWEMMTLAMPHLEMLEDDDDDDEEVEDSMEESFDEDAYYERLGTRPELDVEALGSSYRRTVELFYLCTDEDPKKRPSAAQIVQALESNALLDKTPSEVIVID